MAVNLDDHIRKIRFAVGGETVRETIVDALNFVFSSEKTASQLGDHPAGDYVLNSVYQTAKFELDKLIDLCDQINGHSTIDIE